jgi:hypothetical protein
VKRCLRLGITLITLVVCVGMLSATAAGASGSTGASGAAPAKGRFLLISMPYIDWTDLELASVPNIDRFMKDAAIANLTTRTGGGSAIGSAYVTLGAGTRGIGGGTGMSGEGLEVDEPYGDTTAGQAFEQRTGHQLTRGIVQLGIEPIRVGNASNDLDAQPGALGEALRLAGYSRAVIANADITLAGTTTYGRDAVNGLMGPGGIVPTGRVDSRILRTQPTAPFGVELNNDRVVAAFDNAWKPGSVVMVEASDIVRARALAPVAAQRQQRVQLITALENTDRLVGRLLQQVDLRRDSVMIVSPAATAGSGTRLTIAALRGPGVEPGFLRSASTRRAGFVQLVDIAPTVLDRLGLDRAKTMQGRPMLVVPSDDSIADRRSSLIDSNDAADFRGSVFTAVALAFIALQAALALGLVLVIVRPRRERLRRILWIAAPGALGFVLAVYLARFFPFYDYGIAPYVVFLTVVSIALGFAYRWLGRAQEFDTALVALGAIVTFLVLDVATGSNLQFNSAFGVSASIGIRLTGFGNTSYAAISASALFLAAIIAHRVAGRRGAWIAISVLALVIVADGAPFLGSDVGGLLSLIPAYGVFAALLLGIRLHPWRTALYGTIAAIVGLALAAGIDLLRPAGQRTHLGRLVEQVHDEGISVFLHSISNKLDQNISSVTNSVWGLMLPIAFAFIAYLYFRTRLLHDLIGPVPEFRKAIVPFLILGFVGYAVNDSGIVVPGMMLAILDATLITILVNRIGPGQPPRPKPAKATAPVQPAKRPKTAGVT